MNLPTLARAAMTALLVLGLALPASADEIPKPREGWWKVLKGGETATWEAKQMGKTMTLTLTVKKVDGAKLTVETVMKENGEEKHKDETEVDATDESIGKPRVPPGATTTKGATKEVKAAGQTFKCTEYTFDAPDMKLKMSVWLDPSIPPIFNGGTVKMSGTIGPQETSMELTSYRGPTAAKTPAKKTKK